MPASFYVDARMSSTLAPPPAAPPPSRIEAEVHRAQALMKEGRYAEVLAQTQALEAEVPENRDVLYLLAMAQRYLRRTADALATLERLEQFHPRFSRLFQERGNCHVALRDTRGRA